MVKAAHRDGLPAAAGFYFNAAKIAFRLVNQTIYDLTKGTE
jgi:hypothetical protein